MAALSTWPSSCHWLKNERMPVTSTTPLSSCHPPVPKLLWHLQGEGITMHTQHIIFSCCPKHSPHPLRWPFTSLAQVAPPPCTLSHSPCAHSSPPWPWVAPLWCTQNHALWLKVHFPTNTTLDGLLSAPVPLPYCQHIATPSVELHGPLFTCSVLTWMQLASLDSCNPSCTPLYACSVCTIPVHCAWHQACITPFCFGIGSELSRWWSNSVFLTPKMGKGGISKICWIDALLMLSHITTVSIIHL